MAVAVDADRALHPMYSHTLCLGMHQTPGHEPSMTGRYFMLGCPPVTARTAYIVPETVVFALTLCV